MKIHTLVSALAVSALSMVFTSSLVAAEAKHTIVTIQNFSFDPETLTVPAGTTVTWLNTDDEPHNVTSVKKKFRSGPLPTNKQFSFTFKDPGTYNYICSIHPYMKGKVVVQK